MNNERKLSNEMMDDQKWLDITNGIILDRWSVDEQVELEGTVLADMVVQGQIDLDSLRAGVIWANALDREAVEAANGNIISLVQEDRVEALARRIAHHVGRFALEKVKSRTRLNAYIANRYLRHKAQ